MGPRPAARLATVELRKANHELREANRKLEETRLLHNKNMALQGQLMAEVAHEIRNPLSFVTNNLFLIEAWLDSLGPAMPSRPSETLIKAQTKARAWLGEIREGLECIDKLVHDLRTSSGPDENKFEAIDVCDSIDSVLLMLRHQMEDRINVEKLYGPARILHCCARRLNQLLMNLLSNAIAAIAATGNIVITTTQVGGFFRISIQDDGTGIPEFIYSKIFEPFVTTKAVGQGTGLGLAISHGIVKDHGGSIEVRSEEGVGTEVLVKIPLNPEARRGVTHIRK